jgi:protein archease
MPPTHVFFDHTGDYGVDLSGESYEELLDGLARAFLDLLTGEPSAVAEVEARPLEVSGLDEEDLLVALGNELLYRFEMGFLVARLEVEAVLEEDGQDGVAGELSLEAKAWGEAFDPERHPIARPMKAVTHHQASVVEDATGARARLVFDL